MSISFLKPELLMLLVLLPLVWFIPRRAAGWRHPLIRCVVLLLLVLGMARPVSLVPGGVSHHAVILDLSSSVEEASRVAAVAVVRDLVRDLPASSRVTLVAIGDAPRELESDFDSVVRLSGDSSPLSAAISVATAAIPMGENGAVTILSDGLSTQKGWAVGTESLTARGIPVHTHEIRFPAGDLRPVGMKSVGQLRMGHTGRVVVDVVGGTGTIGLSLHDNEGVVAELEQLEISGRTPVAFEFEPRSPGFHEFRVSLDVLDGDDSQRDNNELRATLAVQPPIRVLYLGERQNGGSGRLAELVGAGFDIESGVGDATNALEGHDLVMIDDLPATGLSPDRQQEIVDRVRNRGLGLLVSGGNGSFGPGGYFESPLAEALPVEFVQKEEKKDPSTSLAVIIDTSGSMTGNRIRLAKEVTRLAIRRLLPHDKIGIVEFYGNKRWAAPLQSAANAINIQRALNRLDAGGGTILFPAVEEAFYGLRNIQTRYKHVLILTDGGVETGAYESIMRRMNRDGICVSTVLVGPGRHSEFLVQMADWGNGRYYNASDRFNLPEIMLKQPSTARLPAYRRGEHPLVARGGAGWWGQVDSRTIPSLEGYVETRSRPGAEVVLATAREEHPVLANWGYGLGQVTAFTTEPTGEGTGQWRDWGEFGAAMGRWMSRAAGTGRNPFSFTLERSGYEVLLRAVRLENSGVLPTASAMGTDAPAPLTFHERAPGVFDARFFSDPGSLVRVTAGCNDPMRRVEVYRVSDRSSQALPESNVDPRGALDLTALSRATGGVALGTAGASAELPTGGGSRPWRVVEVWPWLLAAALLAYLFELVWRRSSRGGAWA